MSQGNDGQGGASTSSNIVHKQAAAKPAILGSFAIDPFDHTATTWRRWVQRLRGALMVFGIEGHSRVPYLLHYVGTAAFDMLCDRLDPEDPFDTLIKKLEEFYDPAPLEISENYIFHQRRQEEQETVQQFLAALHKLSIHCKFGEYHKTALRNQLVFGLRNKKAQARLLEKKDLTLDEAINVAVTMEMTEKGTDQMNVAGPSQNSVRVDYLKAGKKPFKKQFTKKDSKDQPRRHAKKSQRTSGNFNTNNNNNLQCYRCGKTHLASKCTLSRDIRCDGCGKPGHLRSVCFTSRVHVKQIVDIQEIRQVEHTSHRNKFLRTLEVNGKHVEFELDTGAAVTIMSEYEVKMHFNTVKIKRTNLRLVSYCSNELHCLGYISVKIKYNTIVKTLNIYVVRGSRKPLLGRKWIRQLFTESDCFHCMSSLNKITVGHEVTLRVILDKFLINSECSSSCSKIKEVQAKLTLKPNSSPVFLRARTLPFKMIPLVEQELDNLEKAGIIERVMISRWATPRVPILKRDGTVRICGDYKTTVNPNLIVDDHPLPTTDELFAKLAGGTKFTKIDLKQAYLQMEIAPEDREVLTISTCKGLYRVNRLMYGIAPGPTIWQRELENILRDIPGVAIFIDDIIITGESDEVHLARLEAVLERFRIHNITLNTKKCVFFLDKVSYCGYTLDKDGVHKDIQKMEAIKEMRRPTNITEVRAFTGMVNYYGRFIRNLSTILHPLNNLLRKNKNFHWSKDCEWAFQEAKKAFTSNEVLAYFDTKIPLVLATDASPTGVGAVLSHKYADGTERVLQYASQAFSTTQAKYSQIDKEAYAIIFGVKKFYQFLYGNRFTLITDHRPLVQIFSPVKRLPIYSAMRMQHYAIFLQGFNYQIKYRRSEDHANADCLSRLPAKEHSEISDVVDVFQVELLNNLPVTADSIAYETKKDKELNELLQALQSGNQIQKSKFHDIGQLEFTLQNNVIMRGHRVVIPIKLRSIILRELHSGHFGVVKMKNLARNYCWWPGMDNEIENLSKNCAECRAHMNNPTKIAVHPWQPPSAPMQRVHLDFAGPFLGKNFFILVDAYSKWPEVYIMKDITSGSTIKICEQIFAAYGIPHTIVSATEEHLRPPNFKIL